MKVNLKDIAEETGFSISTISRVLNGSDKISAGTVEKVLRSAKKLGYKSKKRPKKSNKTLNTISKKIIILILNFTQRVQSYGMPAATEGNQM